MSNLLLQEEKLTSTNPCRRVKHPVRPSPKPVAKPVMDNCVPDSDDSDDDKPLTHRKSMSLQMERNSKPDAAELKASLTKKRPAGQTYTSPNQSAVKKLKILHSGQQSQKSSLQSSKSALHSPRTTVRKMSNSTPKPTAGRVDTNDDDDAVPLAQRITTLATASKSSASTTVKKLAPRSRGSAKTELERDDHDDDYVPLAKRAGQMPSTKPVVKPAVKPKVVTTVKKPSASSAKSITKKILEQRRKGKGTVKTTKHVVKTKTTMTESKMIQSGGTQKWETLEHSGVIFSPSYQPHGVKMLYRGKPVTLTPEQEDVIS